MTMTFYKNKAEQMADIADTAKADFLRACKEKAFYHINTAAHFGSRYVSFEFPYDSMTEESLTNEDIEAIKLSLDYEGFKVELRPESKRIVFHVCW